MILQVFWRANYSNNGRVLPHSIQIVAVYPDRMKKIYLALAAAVLGSVVCYAGTETSSLKLQKDKTVTPVDELFRSNEFDVGVFGAVALGGVDQYNDRKNSFHSAFKSMEHQKAWGGGVEADYFFTRYFGLGVEGDWFAANDAISSVSGNLIGRYPFEYGTWGWAPYGFVGGGGQFDSENAGFGQAGGGVEVRFKSHWGIFADGRYVIHDIDLNYTLIRAGIRINF